MKRTRNHTGERCRRWRKRAITLVMAFAYQHFAQANCIDGERLYGVNLAGAEYNAAQLPGVVFKDYVYPDPEELHYFHSIGMNAFRLPVRWERLQPKLLGDLDAAELHRVQDVVALAHKLKSCVILDVHNFGEYRGKPIGSADVPASAFIDLWQRLLTAFPEPADVAFDLMNEPSKLTVKDWAALAQQTVYALRKSQSKHLLLIEGGRWAGAHDWSAAQGGVSNADAFRTFEDPADSYAIEVHQYPDEDHSGTGASCIDAEKLKVMMTDVTQWGESTGHRLFLGEFGAPANPRCLESLDAIVASTKRSPAWLGFAYWAAGRWWGDYPYSIEPKGSEDKPQLTVLRMYMPH
jgi:endoglucanase